MGIKMDLSASNTQASSVSSASQSRVASYESALTAIFGFISEQELKGRAYDSARTYAKEMFVPLFQAAILYEERVAESINNLPSRYINEVGVESLDQDILQSQIDAYDQVIAAQQAVLDVANKQKGVSATTKESIQSSIDAIQSKRDELRQKLDNLIAFDASSPSIFDSMDSLKFALSQALALMTDNFASFNGTFKLPSAGKMKWVNKVNKEFKKRDELNKSYLKALKKLEKGEKLSEKDIKALQVYAERYPNKELPKIVEEKLKLETTNLVKTHNLKKKVEEIKKSNLPEGKKTEAIVKAYEDYLYNFSNNKDAFLKYNEIRKEIGKEWDPKKNGTSKQKKAFYAEKNLKKSLTKSGIDMKQVLQDLGDDVLEVNKNDKANTRWKELLKSKNLNYLDLIGEAGAYEVASHLNFYNMVQTGKPLDLKSRVLGTDGAEYSIWARDWGGGVKEDYAGNYLYGYVGNGYVPVGKGQNRANYLKTAAGAAQLQSDLKNSYNDIKKDPESYRGMGIPYSEWLTTFPNKVGLELIDYEMSLYRGEFGDNSGDAKMIQDGAEDYAKRHSD